MNHKKTVTSPALSQQAASLFAQGLGLHQQGQLEAAKLLYQQVLSIKPAHSDALQLMGTLALQQMQYDSAIEWFQRSLKFNGRNPNALNNLGLSYKNLGRFAEALQAFDRALSAQKGFPDAQFNRASVLAELGRFEDANAAYDKLLPKTPNDPELHFRKGRVLAALAQTESALTSFNQAVALAPNHLEAVTARGVLLSNAKQHQRALQDFETAARLAPQLPSSYNNLGNALSELDRIQDALSCYDRAIQLDPAFVDAHFNAGVLHQSLQQIDKAISAYLKVISIAPAHVYAQWNLGLCQLMTGQYAEGWKQYEWRWKNSELDVFKEKRKFDEPLWDGTQSLAGKTVLLYSEQGLGDTIQFCRYAKQVANLGAKVILEVQQPLVRLLAGLDGVTQLIERGDSVPRFDFQCPLMSLPLAFGTLLESIPAHDTYLQSDSSLRAKWLSRLGSRSGPHLVAGTTLRVGVVWRGRASHADDRNRSANLIDVLSLRGEGIQLISLQNELTAEDLQTLQDHPGMLHFGAELTDMAETAALCDLMDVVISVDTSIAHLAGALGKPVYVMLPFVPDWRWLLNRDDSPWYPSAKLFRQTQKRQWQTLLAQIQLALEQAGLAKRGLAPAAASPETP